jgi:hypothetical protein
VVVITLEATARLLEGLGPVIDPELGLVRSECPICWAGRTDPDGIWAPLHVIVSKNRTIIMCDACGVSSHG